MGQIELFCLQYKHLITYRSYCNRLLAYLIRFRIYLTKFNTINKSDGEIKIILLEFAKNKQYSECVAIAVAFNTHMEAFGILHTLSKSNIINPIEFIEEKIDNTSIDGKDENTHITFINQYYPLLSKEENIIKNNITIKNSNIILTGSNASGKTTILKSFIINIILSQQFGYGYYESGTLLPYHYLYSYLNIPDTSNRDSLFQAESRRCKSIIDNIQLYPNKRHLCIIDELFSGTNPSESVITASAYVKYLSQCKLVTFLLTTHYLKVCKCSKYKTINKIDNYCMGSTEIDNVCTYTYVIQKGVTSDKNGAYRILHDMDYPKEILEELQYY
jgi:hypothetical protein